MTTTPPLDPKHEKYARMVVADLDASARHERPEQPGELYGWTPAMVADTLRNQMGGRDAATVIAWRQWIHDVYVIEGVNVLNLRAIMRAIRQTIAYPEAGYARMMRDYLRDVWDIGAGDVDTYLDDPSDRWITDRANIWPGPGRDWRDPCGVARGQRE